MAKEAKRNPDIQLCCSRLIIEKDVGDRTGMDTLMESKGNIIVWLLQAVGR